MIIELCNFFATGIYHIVTTYHMYLGEKKHLIKQVLTVPFSEKEQHGCNQADR